MNAMENTERTSVNMLLCVFVRTRHIQLKIEVEIDAYLSEYSSNIVTGDREWVRQRRSDSVRY